MDAVPVIEQTYYAIRITTAKVPAERHHKHIPKRMQTLYPSKTFRRGRGI